MAAYLIVDISVQDREAFNEYVRLAPPVEDWGGRWLVRGVPGEQVEGDWQPERTSVCVFPTMDAARDYFASPGYRTAKAMRQGAVTARMTLAEGDDV